MSSTSEAVSRAIKHFEAGQIQAAEKIVRQVVEVQPTHLDALHFLGILLLHTGRNEEAAERIQSAITISPTKAVLHGNLGLALKAQGRLSEAIDCYQEALRLKPDYIDALCHLGAVLQIQGQTDEAINLYQRALSIKPESALALSHLGASLQEQGKLDEAITSFRSALAIKPKDASTHHNLGNVLEAQGELDAAAASYRQALQLKPDSFKTLCNLGYVLKSQNKLADAVKCLQDALKVNPGDADVHFKLGTYLEDQDKLEEAANSYRQAVHLQPNSYEAYHNLGATLLKLNKYDDAVASYQHALILKPDNSAAHNDLGDAFERLGHLDDAVINYRRAIHLDPTNPVAYNNLGSAVQKQGILNEAIAYYQQAVHLKQDYATAHCNLGTAFQKQNRHDYAIACYQHALLLNPDHADARYNLGMAWLQLGEFAAGWPEFEWRIKVNKLPEFRMPKWDGSALTGRRILLLAEQGLGDTIQFIRYAEMVKQCGGYVIFACQEELMALLKGCPGIDVLVPQPKSAADSLPRFDVYLHLLSIPRVLGTTLDSIPGEVPYLHADEQLVAHWKSELAVTGELKVGLAWQGNRRNPNDRARSIRLSEYEPLGRIQGVKLFSLQRGDGSEQVRSMAGRLEISDLNDRLDEFTGPFLDTAAVMMNLDLVITSDTSIAHLAGALGVPVWVALNHSADWRWLLNCDDSPWYPTMRLFRQEIPGDWAGVFRKIAAELRRFKIPEGAAERALKTESQQKLVLSDCEASVLVETSIGELIDKITILEIKAVRISDTKKLINIRRELASLRATFESVLYSMIKTSIRPPVLDDLIAQLKSINETLWDKEDAIRECDRSGNFGSEFVELARSVYGHNDQRTTLKRQLNELLGSRLVEEKSYLDPD